MSIQENPQRAELEADLRDLLSTFEIPLTRLETLDLGWLIRNLAIQNRGHPDLGEALSLIKQLLRGK